MSDVFKRTEMRYGGTFAPDKGLLVPNKGLTGVLMQNLQVNHARQKSTIFDIGTSGQMRAVYYVGGPTQGNMTVGHVLGPDIAVSQFYDSFSDLCEVDDNSITLKLDKQQCGRNSNATSQNTYTCKFCTLVNVGFSVDATNLMIREQSALDFIGMEIDERVSGALNGAINSVSQLAIDAAGAALGA